MKIIVLALFGFILTFLLPSFEASSVFNGVNSNVQYKDCSNPDAKTRMALTSLKISPDNVVKGQKINIDVETVLHEEVTSGQVDVKLNYGVIPIVDESLDLCDLVTQINKECPLKKGVFSIKLGESLPGYIPAGSYQGNATISDQNKKELMCLELTINLK